MSGGPASRGLVVIGISIALAACSREAPAPGSGERLAPLPEPPRIEVEREALPGDGTLAVVVARPTGEAAGAIRPTVTFNKPVVALEAADGRPAFPATVEPPVPGEWRWIGSAAAEFVPESPLPYATSFRIRIPAGLTALDGSTLAEPYVWEFHTPRPHLQATTPPEGFAWLAATPRIELLFDQPLKDLVARARFAVEGGAEVPVRVVEEMAIADEVRKQQEAEGSRPAPAREEFRNRQTRYVVEPASPLPLDTAVTLVIDAELGAREGPRTMGEGRRLPFRTHGPMGFTGAKTCGPWTSEAECPEGPLVLLTTNPADLASLKARLRLDPPAEIDWDHAAAETPSLRGYDAVNVPYVSLPGRYRPGTVYRISVSAGAVDVFGQAAPAFEGTARTADLYPDLRLKHELALLEAAGDGALPVETVNLQRVEGRVWSLDPGELARLLARRWCEAGPCKPEKPGAPVSLDVSGERNVPRTTPLPLRDFLKTKTGLFHVEVRSPELDSGEWGTSLRTVTGQITDLAVHAKLGATSGVAWVTSLATGGPVAGADVSVYDRKGARRWEGKSDADGLARLPGLAPLLGDEDQTWGASFALVAAAKDGDVGVTLSTWQGELSAGAFDLPTEWAGKHPVSLGTVFAERGIYRPGDEVFVKGLVRYRRLGAIAAPPPGTPVKVEVRSSTGDTVFTGSVPLTAFGTFSAKVPVAADAPLGEYGIQATAAAEGGEVNLGGGFRVEEYRAPQFRVEVTPKAPEMVAGQPLAATVLARYLHGGAMADAAVRWTVTRLPRDFVPPGVPGFTFGPRTWFWDDDRPEPGLEVFAGGQARTGEAGAVELAPGTAVAPGDRTYAYTVEAEVADVNRQRVANRAAVVVHPASFYTGVRVADGFATAGKPVRVEVVAVDPAGVRKAGERVAVEVRRREWKSIRKRQGSEWFTTSEPVETRAGGCDLRTETAAVACTFTPAEPGLYVVEAVGTDAGGRRAVTRAPFYAVGEGWVSWQRTDSDRLDLVADRQRYGVGDTAKILVKSPFPEAEALVTVEREGVRWVRRTRLAGAASTVEVPVEEWMVPNAYVSVVLVRGRVPASEGMAENGDPGRPAVRVGYVELGVEKRDKRLAVSLTPDAAEKRPREKLAIDVSVKDAAGKGRRAEVTVWAVDEGVLRLTGYEVPDPVELIHPRRGLSVRNGEPLLWLVERQKFGDKGRSPGGSGGGDAAGSGFRSRFKTTVLFAPEVVTDAAGRARVEVELPDNLTTYRILAVAVTEGEEAGAAVSQVTVTKPLLVLPALPRLARVGDSFEAGVVVHGKGLAGEGTVTVAAEGIRVEEPAEQRVPLAAGPREVRFRFRAEREGTAVLRFAVAGAGERDGVEARLPVALPVALEAVAAYGDTRDRRVEEVVPPAGVRPGVGGLEVTLASTALVGLDGGMRQLVEYPYGCLEQLSSRLVPFVALRELSGKFGVPWTAPEGRELVRGFLGEEPLARFDTSDPDEVVRATVRQIQALQHHDGGFRYWSSDGCSSPYASAYAVLALGRAREVGYPVDGKVLARGQQYLAETVAAGRNGGCRWDDRAPDDTTRTWALWALARTGAPRPSYYGELFGRREALPLFARALLSDAMFVGGGDRAQARQVLKEVLNHARETAADVHFQELDDRTHAALWSSDTRTTAIVLLALADVSPDHPYVSKIARRLTGARGRDGAYGNTQEAAFSLMALAEVARVKESETPDFTARVTLGDREVAERRFAGRSLSAARVAVPAAELRGGKLVFAKEGAGVLYYGALLRYAPAEVPLTPADRGLVVQRWFEPWEGGGQARAFAAGELVRVRVRVGTPAERQFVAVEVPLPAGLEAVDVTLASTAALPRSTGEEPAEGYEYESAGDTFDPAGGTPLPEWALQFWSPFHHVERRDDRVVLFADRLPPGVHAVSFVARATTPGDFLLLPAHAHEMYAPEVNGRSDGGRLQVTLAAPVAER